MNATELRNITNCPLSMCAEAVEYAEKHNGGYDIAIAYLLAKTLAVKTNCSFDERVQRFIRRKEDG